MGLYMLDWDISLLCLFIIIIIIIVVRLIVCMFVMCIAYVCKLMLRHVQNSNTDCATHYGI